MRYFKQKILGPKIGSCFGTCIACLIDCEVDEVPNFVEHGHKWLDDAQDWMFKRGLFLIRAQIECFDGLYPLPIGTLAIGSGKSPRSDSGHACIVRWSRGEWHNHWDVHPDATFHDGPITGITMIGKS